jgi:ribosomal protein L34E
MSAYNTQTARRFCPRCKENKPPAGGQFREKYDKKIGAVVKAWRCAECVADIKGVVKCSTL